MFVPLDYYYARDVLVKPMEVNREIIPLDELTTGFRGIWLVYWNASILKNRLNKSQTHVSKAPLRNPCGLNQRVNVNRQTNSIIYLIIMLMIPVAFVGLGWVNYQFSVQNPGGNDFLVRWMGARKWLIEGINPYDNQVSLASQELIYGRPADPSEGEDVAHFVYPLHSMVFFAPFGLFDYTLARALWMTVLEISLIILVFVSLGVTKWRVSSLMVAVLVLFSLIWYHGSRTIIIGQFAGINALLIALALLLIQQKQDVAAGILLALSTSKPQMSFLLVPFVLLWALSVGRSRLVFGILGGFIGLIAISLVLIPDWPIQMLGQVLEYLTYTARIDSVVSIIANTAPGFTSLLNAVLNVAFGLYLLIEWGRAWGKDENWFLWTVMMTVVVTNIVAIRTATTNYVMLLPVLFLVFRVWEQRWGLVGKVGIWLTLLVFLVGLWFLFFKTVVGNEEHAFMYIPLPFYCLFGLWWVRWWALRPPKLFLEDFADRMG